MKTQPETRDDATNRETLKAPNTGVEPSVAEENYECKSRKSK